MGRAKSAGEEAKEETCGISGNTGEKTRRVFSTAAKGSKCIVAGCNEDHPPWGCDAFKTLPVSDRKSLIAKSKRCFRCLAMGHLSVDIERARVCSVDGCKSDRHSRYLHDSSRHGVDTKASPPSPAVAAECSAV